MGARLSLPCFIGKTCTTIARGDAPRRRLFGFSAGEPKKAVVYLTLIGDTQKDPQIQAVTKRPDFVVSFGGPSVKLLAKDTKGFSPEELKAI